MKKLFIWILIICTIFIFAYAFSASYNSQNIDRLDYVIAIGIDKSPNDNNLQVSFEFTDLGAFSESDSSQGSKPIIDTVVAPSIPEAVNLMNAYAGKQVNLSHCKVVIFSEDIAKTGILEEVTYLMNDPQIRPTTNIIIATETAKGYIENSTSSLEGILTKYYDIFPTSAEYTGYTSNILLSRFYQSLTTNECGSVAIFGTRSKSSKEPQGDVSQNSSTQESSMQSSSSENEVNQNNTSNSMSNETSQNSTSNSMSDETNQNSTSNSMSDETSQNNSSNSISNETNQNNTSNNTSNKTNQLESVASGENIVEGDRGTENIGLAVFKNDCYIGNLSATETLCYTLIEEEVDNFSVCIDNPINPDKKIDLSVSSLEPAHTKIDVSNGNPILTIKLNLTAKALTGQDSLVFSDKKTLDTVNIALKEYLTSKMKDFLYKTSREYKCDLNGFYRLVKQKFLTIPEYENYNWEQKYQNAEFNIEIDSNVISSFLVQNS